MNIASVIIKPLITEKSVALATTGKYTFIINPLANKTDVRNAVKKIFNAEALSIRVITSRSDRRRVNYYDPTKGSRIRKSVKTKKAIVEFPADTKIDYFEVE